MNSVILAERMLTGPSSDELKKRSFIIAEGMLCGISFDELNSAWD